jgi:hypothetical protein
MSQIVPFYSLTKLNLVGVTEEDIETLFYHEDPVAIPRILYEDGVAIVHCLTHEVAASLYEFLLLKRYDVAWHLDEWMSEVDFTEEEKDPYWADWSWTDEDDASDEFYQEMSRRCPRHYMDYKDNCYDCLQDMRMGRCY